MMRNAALPASGTLLERQRAGAARLQTLDFEPKAVNNALLKATAYTRCNLP